MNGSHPNDETGRSRSSTSVTSSDSMRPHYASASDYTNWPHTRGRMLGRQPCCLSLCSLVFLSATASAQSIDSAEALNGNSAPMGYATFALELLAFVTKETLPDSEDEFPESLIGSRLSRSMPEQRSEFGSHCLTVVTQLGSALPYLSARSADDSVHAPAAPALRRMWSAFENGAGGVDRDLSLNFKVGANKVGTSLTFHW